MFRHRLERTLKRPENLARNNRSTLKTIIYKIKLKKNTHRITRNNRDLN